MKKKTEFLLVIAFLFGCLNISLAQIVVNKPTEINVQNDALKSVSMDSYEKFKKSVQPLVDKMGVKKIVGLGEGTHGTAEFYKLRYWITRILVEEHGFNHIAFENDFSDGWLLNKKLNTNADLNQLMKKYMLSIWQNEEVKELLIWVKNYNKSHNKKLEIDAIDYVFINADIEMLEDLLGKNKTFLAAVNQLQKPAAYQDSAWIGMNRDDFKYDMNMVSKNAYAGYLLADSLDQKIMVSDLNAAIKADSHIALVNIKQAFAPFYHMLTKTAEASRDANMATTATLILSNPNDKMIIWAHDAHLAKKEVFDGAVGGTGGELLKKFPNNYFVLGTGTATGTFAATTESRDTYTNPMKAYPLESPIKESWETLLTAGNKPNVYFYPTVFNIKNEVKPLRIVGYTPKSGPTTFDKTNLSDHYDAFMFISNSHAATPLK
ncbi:erythromycin esterase family protein [Pedobacter psychrodurus]|uniref:erythromycin esterase family protein n=1 Tax=Pedobacter psychrodurus TaxID=2530456 RepID=UPI00292CCA17|nr:erythromycin esterase family protein [Pedobacter psychrodurus]